MVSGKRFFIGLAVAAAVLFLCIPSLHADLSQSSGSEVTVNYVVDSGCGTNSPDNPAVYAGGSVPLVDAIPDDGYRFAGWYVVTTSLLGSSYNRITDFNQYNYHNETVNVYAFWYYTVDVIYDLNGGTLEEAQARIITDEISTIGTPECEGRSLYAWNYSITSENSNTVSNGVLTLVANTGTMRCVASWDYNITYLGVEDAVNSNPPNYHPGRSITLVDLVREGFEFVGWYDESDNKVTKIQGRDYTLTAKWVERARSSITYDLDGGTMVGDLVDWYYEGEVTAIPAARKDGFFFNGWMINGERSGRIEYVGADLKGDITLVPWWIPVDDVRGHGYVLDYDMTASQGIYSQRYHETETSRYYEYDEERGFFVVDTTSDNRTRTYWTGESESQYEFQYLGMENYSLGGKEYLCEVYLADYPAYYEKQYIYGGWIPVFIDFHYRSGWVTYMGTYTLSETIEFDIAGTFDVKGYGDAGILVTGNGSYNIGSDAELVAEVSPSTVFRGWYTEDGTLVCEDPVYRFTVYTDIALYACNDDDTDYVAVYGQRFTLPHPDCMTEIVWNVTNSSTGESTRYEGEQSLLFDTGGSNYVVYSGKIDGETVYCFYVVVSDGFATRSFEWVCAGKSYSLDLDIMYSDFMNYRNDPVTRSMVSVSNTMKFVTSDDRYVVQIAKYIMTQTYGMSDTARMNVLLAFVDYIEYKYDSDSMGQEEYFKYPLETLYDQNGDCEDTSILFCAVASAMGYRSALLLFSGHMAASVEITDGSVKMANPATFVRNGVIYFYCETTTTGWSVGNAPSGYTYGGTYYVYPDDQAIMPIASNYRLSDIDFSGSEAIVSRSDLTAADEAGNGLSLRSGKVVMDLSPEVVEYLSSLDSDFKFGFSEADSTKLTKEQIQAIGDGKVYSFTLCQGDENISDLHGTATIHVRYAVPSGKAVDKVTVRYVSEDGSVETMDVSSYSNGFVVFETSHFSVYSVEVSFKEGSSVTLIAVGAIAAILAIGAVLIIRRR